MNTANPAQLCGLWIDDAGKARTCYATPECARIELTEEFRPFCWLGAEVAQEGIQIERLKGEGAFCWLAHADSAAAFESFFKAVREGMPVDVLRPYESQWLLQRRTRLYADLPFAALRRCQLDIETGATEPGAFSDAQNPGDLVLAIGLQCGEHREL